MKKSFIILFTLSLIIFSSSLLSAALCRGSDGYYNDCSSSYNTRTPMFMGNNNPYLVERSYYAHYPQRYYYSSPSRYSYPYFSNGYYNMGYGGYYGYSTYYFW